MRLRWDFTDRDIEAVGKVVKEQSSNPFFVKRRTENVEGGAPAVTRQRFWHAMVGCLLSTQQPSGPESRVPRLLLEIPFPLDYDRCLGDASLEMRAATLLSGRGIRFGPKIAEQMAVNLRLIEGGHWLPLLSAVESLRQTPSREASRDGGTFGRPPSG